MINSPLDYSGCVIWLDGSNSTYFKQLSTGSGDVSNNDPVGYWQNLGSLSSVGNFTNFRGDSTTRPTYVSSLSCLRFDGTNDCLTLSATQNFNQQTLFVVVRLNTFTLTTRIYSQVETDGGSDGGTNFNPIATSNTTPGLLGSTSDSAWANSSYTIPQLSAFNIISHSRNGAIYRNFLNGIGATVFTSARSSYTAVLSRIGAGLTSNTANSRCDISEVIVYNRALTDFERADVEYYLTKKWSVLNSIPRQVYAVKNGVWSDIATWSVSGYESPWGFPVSTDHVYSNSYAVTADQNAFVQSLRTAALSPNIASGGTFAIAQPNITITASPSGFLAGTTTCVTGLLSSGASVLSGNVIAGTSTGAFGLLHSGTGELRINGNIRGNSANQAKGFVNQGNGTLTIFGNVSATNTFDCFGGENLANGNVTVTGDVFGPTNSGNGAQYGILNSSTGILRINGNIFAGGNREDIPGVQNSSAGTVIINGNAYAGHTLAPGIRQLSTGTLIINGNIFASPNANGVVSANTAARNEFTGALINSDNGRQAVYAARYLLKPKVFDSYTFHGNTELVNLLTFSEQIDNAAWVKTATTVTANVSANPLNSAFTGDRLIESATTNAHLTYRSFSTNLSGLSSSSDTTYRPLDLVFSVYAKQAANDRRYMVLALDSGATAGATTPAGTNAFSVIYDLQTGTMPALTSTGLGVITLSSMESAGNGWYRCMIEGRINQTSTPWNIFPTIAISDKADYSGTRITNHYPSYAGNALSGIAIWGAQFEYNSLTPYVSSEFYQGFANRSVQPFFYYAPEAYALSYVPHVSSVKLGTTYAAVSTLSGINVNITEQLTGTMIVPSPQVVSYNVSVDDTVGTALHNAEDVWNVTLSSLTATDAIGTRMANSVTFTEVGSALQTLRF